MDNTLEFLFPSKFLGSFTFKAVNPEEQAKTESKIRAKLEAGKRLSSNELEFLSKYNPVLYAIALRVEMKRKSIENRLEQANSKAEAKHILTDAMASVRREDPAKRYLVAAIQNIEKEFKENGKYQTLPAVKGYAGSRIILLDYKEQNYQFVYQHDDKKEFTAVS